MKDRINCPVCGTAAILEEYERELYVSKAGKKIKFDMITYRCAVCEGCFTTTESDTVVSEMIERKIRNVIRFDERKSKIKKYVP